MVVTEFTHNTIIITQPYEPIDECIFIKDNKMLHKGWWYRVIDAKFTENTTYAIAIREERNN